MTGEKIFLLFKLMQRDRALINKPSTLRTIKIENYRKAWNINSACLEQARNRELVGTVLDILDITAYIKSGPH